MIELAVKEIEKYYGANRIFSNITFEVQSGERVGLIGRNGTGKTTVFKIIAGLEKMDRGSMFIRKNATIGYLDQIPNYPKKFKVIDVLKTSFQLQYEIDKEIKQLEASMGKLTGEELDHALRKYSELCASYEAEGGYDIEENINKVCTGLKLDEDFLNRNFISLSGGEKTNYDSWKNNCFKNQDILLLDEPSNHLDMSAIEWLEGYLKGYKGCVMVISHDRYFLDRVVTKIIEIEEGETDFYNGNYSYFVKEKQRRVCEQFEAYKDQQKKIKAMEKAIKQLRQWAIEADNEKFFKRAASMQKRLDKIERIDKPSIDKPKIKLDFNDTERSGKDVVQVKGLYKAFNNKQVLEDLNLNISYGEAVALIGNNGSGKSTLIKTLLGEIEVDSGEAKLGSNIKIGYLPQNVTFINEELTVLEAFREDISIQEGPARGILAKFLFFGESVFKKVINLSGGEKSRLMLCKLIQNDINLLVLDEPTNHLDIDSRENLEEALSDFNGTIVFISHDRYFINKIAKRICEIENKRIIEYLGDYEYYKEKKKVAKKIVIEVHSQEKKKSVKEKTQKQVLDIRIREVKALEKSIQELEERLNTINSEMNCNGSDYGKLVELEKERAITEERLDLALEKWMEIEGNEDEL